MRKILFVILLLLIFYVDAFAGVLFTYPKFHAEFGGIPLRGGKLYTYIANSSTAKDTYSDEACSVANTNPVVLDANGEAKVYTCSGTYDFVLKSSDLSRTYWTIEDYSAGSSSADEYLYYVDTSATDQCTTTAEANRTLKDIATLVGTSEKATIVIPHTGASNTTDCPCLTTWDASAYTNIKLAPQNGAMLKDSAANPSFTWGGQIEALPTQQILNWGNGSGTLNLGKKNPVIYTGWFGDTGDGTTDDYAAIQRAINVAGASSTHLIVEVSPGVHKLSDQLEIDPTDFITLRGGAGCKGTYLFHRPSGGTEACLKVTGNTIDVSATSMAVNNDGNVTIRDISLGSTVGQAFFGYAMTRSHMENVWMFSAGATKAYCQLDGCNMNTFISCRFSRGNEEYPSEYASVLSDNFTDGLYGLYLNTPNTGARYLSSGENFFFHCRTDGVHGDEAVRSYAASEATLGSNDNYFSMCKFTSNATPDPIMYLMKSTAWVNNTVFEGGAANAIAVYLDNTNGTVQATLTACVGVTDSYLYIPNNSTNYVDLTVKGGSFGKITNDLAAGWRTLSIHDCQLTSGFTGTWSNYTGAQCLSLVNNRTGNAGQMQDYFKLVSASTDPNVFNVYNYGANTSPPVMSLYKGRGTPASPADATSGDYAGEIDFFARASGSFVGAGKIDVNAATIAGANVTGVMNMAVKNAGSGYVTALSLETTRIAAGLPVNLPTYADASAPNSTLYFSSTTSKLTWKDSGGTPNALY